MSWLQTLADGSVTGCEECVQAGGHWIHLRRCLTCGHIGCCDLSEGKHASRHFSETGHAFVQSARPGQNWPWPESDRDFL
jgi:Zn-finger in ubiquitin-hydrolases and other protein